MLITPGTRLGPYEVLAPLGAGGMGEVYRARDSRLGRDVAIKVLPSEVSASEEARQRFEREAQTISKLAHPHICTLFDVGREGGVEYLVMELLDGETLAARLAKGRLPMEQVLRHAADIASALAAAHARGIVHRDLKPANIMLTGAGVKLLDFGLAKAFVQPFDASLANTLGVTPGITVAGVLLGTVPYMAPEQVEGRAVDARTDIFAFGAVLFEMATGVRAFGGTSQTSILTEILTHEPPPLSAIAPSAPPPLDRIVRRCLAKDPAARWSSSADLEIQLREIAVLPAGGPGSGDAHAGPRWRSGAFPWAVAVLALLAGAAGLWRSSRRAPVAGTGMSVRFQFAQEAGNTFSTVVDNPTLAVSPDGSQIAYLGVNAHGERGVWVRAVSALEPRWLAGTAGASTVFWAPDGQSLGFSADDKLQRIALAGGAPAPICELSGQAGISATWGSSGDILFASILKGSIYRVSANGGTPRLEVAANSAKGEWRAGWPWFLPDGKRFLYSMSRRSDGKGSIMYSAPGSAPRELMVANSNTAFTEPGLLVYVEEGTLFARRFDWRAGTLTSGPIPVVDTVSYFLSTGAGQFATSAGGTLVFHASGDIMDLTWLDRSGHTLGTLGGAGSFTDVCIAPDARRLLYSRALPRIGTYDVWSYDVARQTETRLTPGMNSDFAGKWLPGGRGIVFSSVEGGLPRLHVLDLGTGTAEPLLASTGFQVATDVSPDGRTLAYTERAPSRGIDQWTTSLAGGGAPVRMFPPGFRVGDARFSPDGHYVAFLSSESGPFELYVAPFPGPGERVRVSTSGAQLIRWPRGGNEILYVDAGRKFMSVPVRTTPSLQLGTPRELFGCPGEGVWPDFDVTSDGQRILAIVTRVNADDLPLTVVTHWPEGLQK